MDDIMVVVFVMAIVIGLTTSLGWWIGVTLVTHECAKGYPIVKDNKVYTCVQRNI